MSERRKAGDGPQKDQDNTQAQNDGHNPVHALKPAYPARFKNLAPALLRPGSRLLRALFLLFRRPFVPFRLMPRRARLHPPA